MQNKKQKCIDPGSTRGYVKLSRINFVNLRLGLSLVQMLVQSANLDNHWQYQKYK